MMPGMGVVGVVVVVVMVMAIMPMTEAAGAVSSRAGRSVIEETPPARSSPVWVWTESGCSANWWPAPPTIALAPRPAPTVADAATPA